VLGKTAIKVPLSAL